MKRIVAFIIIFILSASFTISCFAETAATNGNKEEPILYASCKTSDDVVKAVESLIRSLPESGQMKMLIPPKRKYLSSQPGLDDVTVYIIEMKNGMANLLIWIDSKNICMILPGFVSFEPTDAKNWLSARDLINNELKKIQNKDNSKAKSNK